MLSAGNKAVISIGGLIQIQLTDLFLKDGHLVLSNLRIVLARYDCAALPNTKALASDNYLERSTTTIVSG